MTKVALAAAMAAAALTSAPLLVGTIPAQGQDLKVAQVDVQIERDRDRDRDRDRRRSRAQTPQLVSVRAVSPSVPGETVAR